ncbi:hypothetical protein GLYMA_12G105200v4 [Glycine max]|nr:hypothetical protein GLYMA_12G105200v4 [Glycine max]
MHTGLLVIAAISLCVFMLGKLEDCLQLLVERGLTFWQSDSRGCFNGLILSPKQGLSDNLEKRSH